MKNQYFGDFSDFCKYALLRDLQAHGLSIAVHWMLTNSDSSRDGQRTAYLKSADNWRPIDPDLFDFLATNDKKEIAAIEESGLLRYACFHSKIVSETVDNRLADIDSLLVRLSPGTLVFFDPDNGFEVKSTSKRTLHKYLLYSEVEYVLKRGHPAIVFQHYGHVNRQEYHQHLAIRCAEELDVDSVSFWTTPHVAFVILETSETSNISDKIRSFSQKWPMSFSFEKVCNFDHRSESVVCEEVVSYSGVTSYRDLRVWKEAFKLAVLIYEISKTFPAYEQYGIVSQMRRSSVSVVSNIAEGYARNSRGEYLQYLGISAGSLAELETQYELSIALGYCTSEKSVKDCITSVSKMLYALRKSLRPSGHRSST